MSSRNQSSDNRIPAPKGPLLYGMLHTLSSSGGNRAPGSLVNDEHAYTMSLLRRHQGLIKYESDTVPNLLNGYQAYTYQAPQPVWTANDTINLIGKLRERSQQTGFNGGNFLGELPQTVGLLGGKVGLLAGALAAVANGVKKPHQKYRKGRRVPPRKEPPKGDSLIANSLLEFEFGVLPLINDVYDLAKIAAGQNVRRTRVRARVSKPTLKITSTQPGVQLHGSTKLSKQIVMVLEQSDTPSFWEQFGLADPATVAWELLPWSFVVDWALPIGKFIEAQSFALRARGTFVTTTFSRQEWSGTASGKAGLYPNVMRYTSVLDDYCLSVSVLREVSTTLAVPLPSLKSNLLGGKPLDRLAEALSLLQQSLGGTKKR